MKSLSLRIAEHVIKTANPKSPLANRAVVFIYKQEIQQAIQRGHSLLSIWTVLHDEGGVDFGYQAFSRHVRKIIHLPDRFANADNQPLSNH
ncbi:TraK family protein [Pseudomonas kurunegalensis]|uniref:TraK family protein n=1 Tax=Pseudomonas kurunegalensis TaxID=485880 RepID=UPI002570776C|nr:TraK family protein [Pseudomonas kurunegalensis]WJD63093.1 TraK family protein [Pseudomonas kurunegalensis]